MSTKIDRGAAVAHDHGIPRSPHWKTVRTTFRRAHPFCDACGPGSPRVHLEVHHVIPYHLCALLGRPDLELDPRNLVVLCEDEGFDHHLLVGHLGDFQTSNPIVRESVSTFFGATVAQIRIDARWVGLARAKPPEWGNMTDQNKLALRDEMDAVYPISPLPPRWNP
jgi:hypothetical protein